MNKLNKILIAILGGVEAVFSIASPILLALLWIRYSSLESISAWFLLSAGIIASVFRAIRVGWLE